MKRTKIYQRIGEFVVCFQWLENLIRQIGWLLDPLRKTWPPGAFRTASTAILFSKVEKLFLTRPPTLPARFNTCGGLADLLFTKRRALPRPSASPQQDSSLSIHGAEGWRRSTGTHAVQSAIRG